MAEPAPTPTSAPRKMSSSALQRRHERNVQKDIQRMQASGKPVIPYTSFSRVVHEVLEDLGEYCIRADAVLALQTATEEHLTDMFVDANNLALYSGRETVSSRDLKFTLPSAPPAIEAQPACPPPVLDLQ